MASVPADQVSSALIDVINLIIAIFELFFDVAGAGGAILDALLQLSQNSNVRITIFVILLLAPVIIYLKKPNFARRF
jgi:hypothetical protein